MCENKIQKIDYPPFIPYLSVLSLYPLPFLRNYPVYYDSFEYLQRAKEINFSNFLHVASASHQPVHSFYFVTILLFKKVFFFLPPGHVLVAISFVFGFLTLLYWYLFLTNIMSRNKALFASILVLIFPYFFVANTNILYESELLFFQIAGLYYFYGGIKYKNLSKIALGGLLWGLSISIFIGSMILLPVLLIAGYKSINKKQLFLFLLTASLTEIIIDLVIFKNIGMVTAKFRSHVGDVISFKDGAIILTLRMMRNILIQSSAILSVSGFVFTVAGGIILLIKKRKRYLPYFLWFIPVFILMQYWHAGFFGRLAIFLVFPSSIILAVSFNRKYLKLIAVTFILITTTNYAFAQNKTAPVCTYYSLIGNLPKNNLAVLTSDYNRFLYQENNINYFSLNGTETNTEEADVFIRNNLNKNKIVLIDSSGLQYPYYQFDGNFYHILSLGKIGQSQIKDKMNGYKFSFYKSSDNKEIFFLRIISSNRSDNKLITATDYPKNHYYLSSNDSRSWDPLMNLFYALTKKKDPLTWSYSNL